MGRIKCRSLYVLARLMCGSRAFLPPSVLLPPPPPIPTSRSSILRDYHNVICEGHIVGATTFRTPCKLPPDERGGLRHLDVDGPWSIKCAVATRLSQLILFIFSGSPLRRCDGRKCGVWKSLSTRPKCFLFYVSEDVPRAFPGSSSLTSFHCCSSRARVVLNSLAQAGIPAEVLSSVIVPAIRIKNLVVKEKISAKQV